MRLRLVALIAQATVVERILEHIGGTDRDTSPATAPGRAGAAAVF